MTPQHPAAEREDGLAALREALEKVARGAPRPVDIARAALAVDSPTAAREPTDVEKARILDFAFNGVRDDNIGPRERIERAALVVPGEAQCPDRCGGIVGHQGPHQSSDYNPAIRQSLVKLVEHLTLPASLDDNPSDPHHMNDGCVKEARAALSAPAITETTPVSARVSPKPFYASQGEFSTALEDERDEEPERYSYEEGRS